MTFKWTFLPLRRIGQVISGGTPSAEAGNWDGPIPFVTPPDMRVANGKVVQATGRTLTIKGLQAGSSLAPPGALLLSIRAPIGYVARVAAPSAFNQGCRALIVRGDMSARFLSYAMQGRAADFASLGRGTTFMEISAAQFAAFQIAVPDQTCQIAIADYLDRETAQIDALIERQHQLIEALRERRNGLISVLSDRVEQLQPLGRKLTRLRQGWSPVCESYPADGTYEWGVLKTGCMNGGIFRSSENKRLPETEGPRREHVVALNEIVISRASSRDWVGSAARVDKDYPRLMLSDLTYGATLNKTVLPQFLVYSMASSRVRGLLQAMAKGSSPSMQKLSQRDLKELPMWFPSLAEQMRIVAELDERGAGTDLLIGKVREAMDLAKERRAALITAAVTGQINVRAAA